jgi:pyridoxal phosphate enzyme (YggS family)
VTGREEQLADRLTAVENRIRAACLAAGRSREEITLVVVTKYFPASDLRILAGLGVGHVGENRHQEAVAKRAECADLELAWHFIGRLQGNKAAAVGSWADVVQSVDRARLLEGLSRSATERGRDLDVLVQVDLDPPTDRGRSGRGGVAPAEAVALAEEVTRAPGLRLCGVMAVAPRDGDPKEAFTELARIRAAVTAAVPTATWLSAGMSGDLEAAVACGATHVRIGTAVLGLRPQAR